MNQLTFIRKTNLNDQSSIKATKAPPVSFFVNESEVIVERSSLNNVSGGKIIFAPILIDTLFSEVKIYESQICRIRELGFVPCQ